MNLNAYKKGLAVAGLVLNVVVLAGLLFVMAATVFSCSNTRGAQVPRPPRGKYTLEQAKHYVQQMTTPAMRARGYRQVKSK